MVSFCIITDGDEKSKIIKEIQSIVALNIPDYEIIVSGNCQHLENVITIHIPEVAKQGKLGLLRNSACRKAKGDIMVVLDDDMYIHPNFYSGLIKYENDFDILSCKILNPDGTRHWDWRTYSNGENYLFDYDKNHPNICLTGGLTIMKPHVFEKVQWNETLGFYQCEDIDFSVRAKEMGFRINFNPFCTITHDDLRYTQYGNIITKPFPYKSAEEY